MLTIPERFIAVAIFMLALFGAGYWFGYEHEHEAWAKDIIKRNAAKSAAIIARADENLKIAKQQADTLAAIQKVHDDEMSDVSARLATAERMRKPAFCGGSTAPAKTESTASSPAPDPASGVLSPEVERNIRALILETEEAAATARACQAFVRDNGMGQ